MNINVFVLGTEKTGADSLFHGMLEKTFFPQDNEDNKNESGAIEYYASVKDATESVSKAFSIAQAVIFFAAPETYGSIKKIIAQAFKVQLIKNETLLEKSRKFAAQQILDDELFEDTHALVPSKGKIFCASDGLFSGFATVRGKQCMIFLPYETDRACALLSQQAIPFLNSMYSQSIPTSFAEHIYAGLLKEDFEQEEVSIAIAHTKTVDLFCEYISDYPICTQLVQKPPKSEDRGDLRPTEYVTNLSIAAAELLGVPYGIVMSNAYYLDEKSKDRLSVFMAVTNDKQTTVREVNSFPWESGSDFIRRCCGELCKLLHDIIKCDRSAKVIEDPKVEKKVFRLRTAIAVVGAVTILLAVAGGYYFSAHGYSLKDWAQKYFPAVLQQQFLPEDEAENTPTLTQAPESSSQGTPASEDSAGTTVQPPSAQASQPASENQAQGLLN